MRMRDATGPQPRVIVTETQQRIFVALVVRQQREQQAFANAENRENHLVRFQAAQQPLKHERAQWQDLAPGPGDAFAAFSLLALANALAKQDRVARGNLVALHHPQGIAAFFHVQAG